MVANNLQNFDIRLNVCIWSQPRFISNQNAVSGAMNQQPKAMHVSKFGKQMERRGNVGSVQCGQMIEPPSNQFLVLVADKCAEAVLHLPEFTYLIYNRSLGEC